MKNNGPKFIFGRACRAMVKACFLIVTACTSAEAPQAEEAYYLKFKVGGVEKEYAALPNSMASFYYLEDFQIYGSTVTAINDIREANKDFVSIQLFNETPFEEGRLYILQDPVFAQSISRARIVFSYFDDNGKGYNAVLLKSSHPTLEINDEAELQFTEIGASHVKGTFQARVSETEFTTLANRAELRITAGEFFLPRHGSVNYDQP